MSQSLIDKDGNLVPHGSLISWNVWDSDDCKMWTLIGTVVDHTQLSGFWHGMQQHVVYLGGGIDFGAGIGKHLGFIEVYSAAENNEPQDAGITVLGLASDVPSILKKEFKL